MNQPTPPVPPSLPGAALSPSKGKGGEGGLGIAQARKETAPPVSPPIWIPVLLKTVATDGTGVPELVAAIDRHVGFLRETGDRARVDRARVEAELETLLRDMLVTRFREDLSGERYQQALDQIADRKLSPWEAARKLLNGRKG